MRSGRDLALHVLDPAFEEGGDRQPGWLDGSAALQFCEQPSNLYLRLALRASESMPAPLAFPRLRITHVDDDGPMAGGTLADMASHLESSLSVSLTGSFIGVFFGFGRGTLGSGVSWIGSSNRITGCLRTGSPMPAPWAS